MYRRTAAALYALILTGCAANSLPVQTQRSDYSPMLERVLPAVVTVAVKSVDGGAGVFGFATVDDPGKPAAVEAAYWRALNLEGFDGSGSGFVIDRDGQMFVVTNEHVISGADLEEIVVFSITQRRYPMRLVGADTYRDVAVLAFREAPGPEIGTAAIHTVNDLRVGMPVFAIGNPLGAFAYSVTGGIVSGLNRSLDNFTANEGYLQTDAELVPGNSGGPLVGPGGDVVGLNTQGFDNELLNFALEGRHLAPVVDDIIRAGRVERAYLGFVFRESADEDGKREVVIADGLNNSPASAALDRLRSAVLLAVNGDSIRNIRDLNAFLEELRPGSNVTLAVRTADSPTREVSLIAGRLDREQARAIGGYIARSVFEAEMAESQDSYGSTVQVLSGPSAVSERMTVLEPGDDAVEQVGPKRGEKVVEAGYFDYDSSVLWRVRELRDLGVIGRMVMPSGWLAIVLETGDVVRLIDVEIPPMLVF